MTDDFDFEQDDADAWSKSKKDKQTKEKEEDNRPVVFTSKINAINQLNPKLTDKVLHEAIILEYRGKFIFKNQNKLVDITDKIEDFSRIIKPPVKDQAITYEYEFRNMEELTSLWDKASQLSIDQLFDMSHEIWDRYIAAAPHIIDLFASATVFSYFQDIFGVVFYLFVIGDNNSGKSAVLDVANETFYRTYKPVSISDAVLYRAYGDIEEGQNTLLLEEANLLSDRMVEMCKAGYKPGSQVLRVEDFNNSKKPVRFFTFGMKLFNAENAFNGETAKGINERCYYVNAVRKVPKRYIAKDLSPVHKKRFAKYLKMLSDFRRLMLLWRIQHYTDDFKPLKLSVEGRDRELTESILMLFYDSKYRDRIVNTLDICLQNKNRVKRESKEALLFDIIQKYRQTPIPVDPESKKQIPEGFFIVTINDIIETFKDESNSEWKFYKPKKVDEEAVPSKTTLISSQFGEITVVKISDILKDRFGGIRVRIGHDRIRCYAFPEEILDGLVSTYSRPDKLRILGIEEPEPE